MLIDIINKFIASDRLRCFLVAEKGFTLWHAFNSLHFSNMAFDSVEFVASARFIGVSSASLVDLLTHLWNLSLHERFTLLKHFLLWFLRLNLKHFCITFVVIYYVCGWLVALEWRQGLILYRCEVVRRQGITDQALFRLKLWRNLLIGLLIMTI